MIDLKIREEELSNMSDYNRVAAMVKRGPLQDEVVFAGGCAYNPCLKGCLKRVWEEISQWLPPRR